MRCAMVVVGWLFTVLFGLLSVPTVLVMNGLPAVLLALAALLCVPIPESRMVHGGRCALHAFLRVVVVAGLVLVGIELFLGTDATALQASPGVRARLAAIYGGGTGSQPVACEGRFVEPGQGEPRLAAGVPDEDPGPPAPPAGE